MAPRKYRKKECNVEEEEVRSIIFRGLYDKKEEYLFTMPYTCLYPTLLKNNNNNNNNNNTNMSNNKKRRKTMMMLQLNRQLDCMFNHSLLHSNSIPLSLPQLPFPGPDQPSGLFEACWAVAGSTIYFFGSSDNTGNKIYYLKRDVERKGSITNLSFKKAGYMIKQRHWHTVVALEGKVYVLGGDKDIWAEVFEPIQDSPPRGHSRALSSPPPSSFHLRHVDFAVAIEKDNKIVAGWNGEDTILEYDIACDSWVYHKLDIEIVFRSTLCKPVAAGSCLYWLSNNMWAYDLDTKRSYDGVVEDCLIQHILETPNMSRLPDDFDVSLLHLCGDLLYMIWFDRYELETLHCTTIQVLKTTTNIQGNHFKLQATVLSCQTFVSKDPMDRKGQRQYCSSLTCIK